MPRNNYVTWSGNPKVEWLTDYGDDGAWLLLEDLTATWHRPGHEGRTVTAKAGFIFDGTSIPKRLRSFISAQGKHFRSSVIHDWLYAMIRVGWEKQEDADLFFKDGLETDGMDEHDEWLMYMAVTKWGDEVWG